MKKTLEALQLVVGILSLGYILYEYCEFIQDIIDSHRMRKERKLSEAAEAICEDPLWNLIDEIPDEAKDYVGL